MRAWSSRCVRYRLKSIGHRPSSEGVVRFQERGPLPANTHLLDSIEKIKSASDRGYNAEDKPSDPFKASEDPPTVASPNLAQSPLTDSRLNAARFGHKQPKAEKGELSQFQIELRKNPYAQALASPLRFDPLTGARLPTDFLLQFGLISNPDTGDPWHLPTMAATSFRHNKQASNESGVSYSGATESEQSNPVKVREHVPPSRTLSGSNLLSSYKAMDFMSKVPTQKYRYLLPYRWKESRAIRVRDIVWREDMADFILNLMRQEIVRYVERMPNSKKCKKDIGPCNSLEELRQTHSVSAVLSFRPQEMLDPLTQDESSDSGKASSGDYARSYALIEHHGRDVPLYQLETLLGSDIVRLLKTKNPKTLGKNYAVVRNEDSTLKLQMALWKLAGYLDADNRT